MRIKSLVLLLFVVLASCGEKKSDKENRQVFRYNEYSNISTLDPAFSKNQAHIWASNQLFNGLVRLDENLQVQSDLAESWEISSDGLTYSFKLKDSIYFHDHPQFVNGVGRALNAQDVKYSLERLKSNELGAPGAWVVSGIRSIKVVGPLHLEIELKEVFPPFLSLLGMKYCSIVPREIVAYYGSDFGRNPIGTGPFKFKVWSENVKLVLVKNDHYHEKDELGNQLPYLDAVAVNFLGDKQAEFMALLQGDLDMLSGLDPSYKDEILNLNGELQERYKENYKLLKGPFLNTEYLGLNMELDLFVKYPELRQAMNIGFDRKQMMKYLRNNVGSPALQGFIPKGLPSFNEQVVYDYDPVEARRLIDELKEEHPGLDISFKIATNSQYLDLCEFIQRQWQDLGIDAQVEVLSPSALKQSKATNKLDVFRASWIADYPDAENYLSLFYSSNFAPNGPNYTHYSNLSYDRLYEKAIRMTQDEARRMSYSELNNQISRDLPVITLYYDQVVRLIPKSVVNMEINGVNMLDLRKVKKINLP
ncbi:MAG: ABC transporter substrate-binding protein [Flavobacteriaceae bacterium]